MASSVAIVDETGSQGDAEQVERNLVSKGSSTEVLVNSGSEEDCEFLKLKRAGNALFAQESYEEAIVKYEEAKTFARNNEEIAAVCHNIGFSHEKLNNLEKAVEGYSDAIRLKDKYIKVLKRRSKLFCTMGRYEEALNDMVDLVVDDIKEQQKVAEVEAGQPPNPNLINFNNPIQSLLVEILLEKTEIETKQVLERRANNKPPIYVVEAFLRSFSGDPVSRIWRGWQPCPVDELIAAGQADDLVGYMAALRDLKLKKYDDIVKHCTEEIENPKATPENILNAHFLRGTMSFIWAMSQQTVDDLMKVVESPLADDKMKSAAHVKLAMRHTNTRHPFCKPDKTDIISEDYGKAEELWVNNPDVYFHGSMLLVDRAAPLQGLQMLEMGVNLCNPAESVMLRTFYWTLKLTITTDDQERQNAHEQIKKLELEFDAPECHEMYAQAIMASGNSNPAEYNYQFDKAIAYNPEDPLFKIKKLIFRHWLGENGTMVGEEDALDEMRRFIEEEGPSNLAYYHIGQMEIVRGNAKAGLEAVDKSIELSGSVHEIEARVAAKFEIIFHLRVNDRLKEEGLGDMAEQLRNLTMKSFP